MIDIILYALKWYIGIGLVFLIIFELLYTANSKEFEEEHPEHAGSLTWKERIATVLCWPYYIFFLFFGK
jgi:hypothetical protein